MVLRFNVVHFVLSASFTCKILLVYMFCTDAQPLPHCATGCPIVQPGVRLSVYKRVLNITTHYSVVDPILKVLGSG